MLRRWVLAASLCGLVVQPADAFTFRRSFRNGYPAELNVSREEARDTVRIGRGATVVSNGRGDVLAVRKTQGFPGTVTRVLDGNTIEVDDGAKGRFVVRLAGVLAPEAKTPDGEAARAHLAKKIDGQEVRVEWREKDARGRLLATVWSGGGLNATANVNLEMVQEGYAQRSRANADPRFAAAQRTARAEKRGLWAPRPPADAKGRESPRAH